VPKTKPKESEKTRKSKDMERNVIAKNTKIVGDILSEGDFRIDGSLEGNLTTKGRVIIGATGVIKGNVSASNSDIEGDFSGELKVVKTLTVKAAAKISGDVVVGKLSIEPGATFNASCAMKAPTKESKKEDDTKEQPTKSKESKPKKAFK
jgi:cytoskeletal protein CcmA (bactofilin family)